MREIDVRGAHRRIADGTAFVIDVREPGEWVRGRAAGVTLVPLGELDATLLPRDRTVLVLCRSGNRSGKATAALVQSGIDAVNVAGGMLAWQAAGLPMLSDGLLPPEVS